MLSNDDCLLLADRYSDSLKVMNAVGFADMKIKPPDINFYPDGVQFFDPDEYSIHIGVLGINEMFHPEDEADFLSALNYIRGHEEQHCRSTASRPYGIAIQKGCEVILEYIQQKTDGYKRRFKSDREYQTYADIELPKKGIYISWKTIQGIVGGIANSLEDGRIERIRAGRFPGFENLRTVYRGVFWDKADEFKPWDEIQDNSGEKLRVITNEILSLATCQLYGKGFSMMYADTPMMDAVNEYMNPIGRAVMSYRTRGLIDPVKEICKGLAPLIYDVCLLSKEDVEMRKLLEGLLKDMIKSMLDESSGFDLSESDEDTENKEIQNTSSPFGHSDLVITLDDETYDKLEKKMKKSSQDDGIQVRREHQKENEEKKESDSKRRSGDTESKENQNEKSDDSSKFSGSSTTQNSENAETSESVSESRTSESHDIASTENTNKESNKKEPLNGKEDSQETSSSNGDDDSKQEKDGGKAAMKNSSSYTGDDSSKDEILKAMKEAAERVREESEQEIARINTSSSKSRSRQTNEVLDTQKVLAAEFANEFKCKFVENKRAYKLTERLPAVLASRGKTLHRKNEMYFKSLSTPNRSYLDSGSVDPSRLYGLSFGDTDVFRKKGVDKKFDGCAYILIDNSGSMAGVKRQEACKAAAVIEEGFKGLIPFKIVAFDESGMIYHEVVKGWEEVSRYNCCYNFLRRGRAGGGNEDGFDIQIATKELLQRPEKKKMLIVLSDGAPGNRELCKKAISDARKAGINVHGIYFEEGDCNDNATFSYMYQRDYICCSLNELDANLLGIFKKFSRS